MSKVEGRQLEEAQAQRYKQQETGRHGEGGGKCRQFDVISSQEGVEGDAGG